MRLPPFVGKLRGKALPRNALGPTVGALCLLLLCCGLLCCCPATAQNGDTEPARGEGPTAEIPTPGVSGPAVSPSSRLTASEPEEAMPSVIYLRDKNGDLQAVVNFSWEDFEEAYKWKHGLARQAQPPQYSIQRLTASGKAVAGHAELSIRVAILTRAEGWVRVPLNLDHAILREPASYQGPGAGFVHFAPNEGHVGWIRGKSGERHEFILSMLVPLAAAGQEGRLDILPPQSTVSELIFKVPQANLIGSVSDRATLQPPVTSDGMTEFTARGIGGDFRLVWHRADSPLRSRTPLLEVEGTVLVHIDKLNVDTEATLSVDGSGVAFDRFLVRLPLGAELVPGSDNGYSIETVAEDSSATSGPRVVEVRRPEKSLQPITVRLTTTRQIKPGQSFELAGFDVVSASRQWGTIAVAAVSDWQIQWISSHGVRRVEHLPEPLQQDDVVAGFQYDSQPCSLSAQLETRKTRINVAPLYHLRVDTERVDLEATLKYTIWGPKTPVLYVALPGWEFDDIEPANLTVVDRVNMGPDGVLSIPLAAPLPRQIELRVLAHREIAQRAGSLVLPLPELLDRSAVPSKMVISPATVIVSSAKNVELIPNTDLMDGLTRRQMEPPEELLDQPGNRLTYQGEAGSDTSSGSARFAADFHVRAQQVAVDVASRLAWDKTACRVEQTLAYTIDYVAADDLVVEIPRAIAEAAGVEFRLDGQLLSTTPTAGEPDSATEPNSGTAPNIATAPIRHRVILPEPRLGSCRLLVSFSVPLPKLSADKAAEVRIPLVMPGDGTLVANRLTVTDFSGVAVDCGDKRWTPEPIIGSAPRREALQWTASEPCHDIRWSVGLAGRGEEGTTVVERAWVQTRLSDTARHDRMVFSLSTNLRELSVDLPEDVEIGQLQVLVDGKATVARSGSANRLIIPLSADSTLSFESAPRRYLLELRPRFPQPRPRRRGLSLQMPRFGQDVWIHRVYWELVLPPSEHVISTPPGFTSEFTWEFNGLFWGRKPLLGEHQLEAWIGVPANGPLPEEADRGALQGTNRYLFSNLGDVGRVEVQTADRFWIVLLASMAALAVGLLLIYVPWVRKPGPLFVVGLAMLGIGVIYPEPTLLLAQAAVLGLLLSLLAGLLQRSLVRRQRAMAFPETSSSIVETGSTQSRRPLPAAGSETSTQTAPGVPPPNQDSQA